MFRFYLPKEDFLCYARGVPTAGVSGGRGIWQENAKGRKCLKALNPTRRGNAPARPPARNVGQFSYLGTATAPT